jgi:hypothetical protein
MRVARWRRSRPRSTRVMRRAWSTAGAASSSDRTLMGSPISTNTFRPLISTAKNLLTRVVISQFSTNSSRSQERSFCGARPQYTAVGTSRTSRAGAPPRRSYTITRLRECF